jgi:hypothetical protein
MTSHSALIRMFVLDAISDDYEDRQKILEHVADLSSRSGCRLVPEDVDTALTELVSDGFARAYWLSAKAPPVELAGMPPGQSELTVHDGYYFWATPAGRALQMADFPDWPFTDNGELRRDWLPPMKA